MQASCVRLCTEHGKLYELIHLLAGQPRVAWLEFTRLIRKGDSGGTQQLQHRYRDYLDRLREPQARAGKIKSLWLSATVR